MKNKRQVTVLATVMVTLEYDTECGLDQEMIKQEVKNQLDGVLGTGAIEWFGEQDDPDYAFVHEVSVEVNGFVPSNYMYE